MDDDQQPPSRRPLGERDDNERQQPFGERRARERREQQARDNSPYTPYRSGPHRYAEPEPPVEAQPPASDPDEEPVSNDTWWDDDDLTELIGEDDDDVVVEDEPENAPAYIRARDQRKRGRADMLKPRKPPAVTSYKDLPDEEPERIRTVIRFGAVLRSVLTILLTAAVVATMFTWWTPDEFLPIESNQRLAVARATQAVALAPLPTAVMPTLVPPTAVSTRPRIGIVSGHFGIYPPTGLPDPGAVCEDGLTERDVNYEVAIRVQENLTEAGFDVDLLEEFDERLTGYEAEAMISIHADSCAYVNDSATGFKVASFEASTTPEQDQRLVDCMVDRYARITGMGLHPSVTFDMTRYHNFAEISATTPGAIIEIGFLYLDRDYLTGSPDTIADAITQGILCYTNNETIAVPETDPPPDEGSTPDGN